MKIKIKITLTLILALLFSAPADGQPAKYELKINIKGLKNSEGKIRLEVISENKEVIGRGISRIENQQSTVIIKDLPPGTYAVKYYHDKNDNRELDTGVFGIPKE